MRSAVLAAAALLVFVLVGGGCSDGRDGDTAATTTSTPRTTSTPPSSDDVTAACQSTLDDVSALFAGRDGVTDVGIEAGCRTVIVATDLPADAGGQADARRLCDEVTGVVFARPDVPNVAVVGAARPDGGARKLAVAQRGEQCTTPAAAVTG